MAKSKAKPEAKTEQPAQDADAPAQNFVIHRTYLKDLSFESGDTPQVFQVKWDPDVNFELNSKHQKIADDTYEVVLQGTLTLKLEEKVAYLVEAQYAGIFSIRDCTEQQLDVLLKSFCPSVIYPYMREVFFDIVNKGSFPQVHLSPINFDAIYAQNIQAQAGDKPAEQADAPLQ